MHIAPESTLQDTCYLWLNMVPLGLAALVRALFWSLGIPFSIWRVTGINSKWEDDFLTILPTSSKQQAVSEEALKSPFLMDMILKELKSRYAHQFPHAGGRRFTDHIVGNFLLCTSRFPARFYPKLSNYRRCRSAEAMETTADHLCCWLTSFHILN
jgi:hypothetical protein